MKNIGKNVGFTTTDGVYIGNRLVKPGDNTGPVSAQMVLRDPTVELAVLETARGGFFRAGLGFDGCDIGIVMNVTADHLGLKGIENLEDMARVKAIVAENVFKTGYAVLNADDKLVLNMRENLKCNIALFSMDENNPFVAEHIKNSGIACVYENNYITLLKGQWKLRVEKVINIPLNLRRQGCLHDTKCFSGNTCIIYFTWSPDRRHKIRIKFVCPFRCTDTGKIKSYRSWQFQSAH